MADGNTPPRGPNISPCCAGCAACSGVMGACSGVAGMGAGAGAAPLGLPMPGNPSCCGSRAFFSGIAASIAPNSAGADGSTSGSSGLAARKSSIFWISACSRGVNFRSVYPALRKALSNSTLILAVGLFAAISVSKPIRVCSVVFSCFSFKCASSSARSDSNLRRSVSAIALSASAFVWSRVAACSCTRVTSASFLAPICSARCISCSCFSSSSAIMSRCTGARSNGSSSCCGCGAWGACCAGSAGAVGSGGVSWNSCCGP